MCYVILMISNGLMLYFYLKTKFGIFNPHV